MMMKYMKLIAAVCAAAWAVASTPESYAGPRKRARRRERNRPSGKRPTKNFRRQETHDRRRRVGHPAQDRRQGLLRNSAGLMGAGYAAGTTPHRRCTCADARRAWQQGRCTSRSIWSDSTVVLVRRNDAWLRKGAFRSASGRLSPRSAATTSGAIPIKVCNDDWTAVVIDATELFARTFRNSPDRRRIRSVRYLRP